MSTETHTITMLVGPEPGKTIEIGDRAITIGRVDECDVVITSPGVSRQHVRIERRGGGLVLTDLGSSNGTYVNGQRIGEPTELFNGDQIRLGRSVELLYTAPATAAAPATSGTATVTEMPPSTGAMAGPPAEDDSAVATLVRDSGVRPAPVVPTPPLNAPRVSAPSVSAPPPVQAPPPRYEEPPATIAHPVTPPPVSAPPPVATPPSRTSEEPGATMIGNFSLSEDMFKSGGRTSGGTALPSGPLSLSIQIAGGAAEDHPLTKPVYEIGRLPENDIVINSPIVSRRHARLEKRGNGYELIPLPDVTNPVYVDGNPLNIPVRLSHGMKIRIGGANPGMLVSMTVTDPVTAQAAITGSLVEVDFTNKDTIQIGRDASNDVTLDVPTVSRFHAVIQKVGQRYRLRDLKSANGTFVNNVEAEGEVWLNPNDEIRIGSYKFVLGDGKLAQFDESGGMRVDVVGLNKWVRKDLNILQDISITIEPREFVVVVGQSGGGKSTLVDAIAGYRPATHGKVYVNGIDVYKNFNVIRNDIGFVPQRDIIHMELSVFEALDYAAQLRMPPDTNKAERHARVEEVLRDLDIAHRRDNPVKALSGGQQKRVSIGVELITKPNLFFLDEPSSGLDPGTETALMQLMRRLADQGRTILLITHATKNVMLADKVVFLARGGYLAWFGPPDEALRYFDQYRSERDRRTSDMEFDQIYALLELESLGKPKDWAERYKQTGAYQQYVVQAAQEKIKGQASEGKAVKPRRTVSALRQFFILSTRNISILTRDRFSLALMLLMAPLVGSLDFIIALALGNNPYESFSPPGGQGNIANVFTSFFLLAVFAIMVGAYSQMREFVKEQDIYMRERLVNLKILPYVMSKIWVAALLALFQALMYLIMRYLAFKMPGGVIEFGLLYMTLVMATMTGMMIGLFASALSPNANSAPLVVLPFVVLQILLGGALIPLPGGGQIVSAITASRWAFENMVVVSGVGADVAADPCWTEPDIRTLATGYSLEQATNNCTCRGLNLFKPDVCYFPGVMNRDDLANVNLDRLPVAPPDPVLPDEPQFTFEQDNPQPQPPDDQSDQVAMADYLDRLQVWQAQLAEARAEFEGELAAYRAQVGVIQAQYQSDLERFAEQSQAYEVAVGKATGIIDKVYTEYGWTFADTDNLPVYAYRLLRGWLALGIMIFIFFVGILFFQARKDVS